MQMCYEYPALVRRDEGGFHLVTFPDLPEAATDGRTLAEALAEAADCLGEALAGRIVDREPIPRPSAVRRSHYRVAPDATLALKLALHAALADRGMSTADLARRLGYDHKEARRLLDPRSTSKGPRLLEALAALGIGVRMTFHDLAKDGRFVSAPTAPARAARSAARPEQKKKARAA